MPSPTEDTAAILSSFTGNSLIDPLIFGVQWSNSTITYSFVGVGTNYYYSTQYTDTSFWTSVQGFSTAQQAATQKALSSWSDVANITFVQSVDNSTTVGDIRLAFSQSYIFVNMAGMTYTPGTNPSAGDLWLNPAAQEIVTGFVSGIFGSSSFNLGSFGYYTLIHELGHALGLWHPFESSPYGSTILATELDSRISTVMSYTTVANAPSAIAYTFNPTTPMVFDILAIQALYGANMSFNSGDTVYSFNDNAGQYYFETIWDGGGADSIVYSGNTGSTIDLNAAYGSFIGNPVNAIDINGAVTHTIKNVWIASGVVIENAVGGSGSDTLIGNDANNSLDGGAGDDTLYGGGGNDTFDWSASGRGGNDTFYGGIGNDVYVLDTANDTVVEYSGEGIDKIYVSFSFSLGNLPYVENLSAFGSNGISLTGNVASNVIRGAPGNDTLDGKIGNDVMLGGAGTDTAIFSGNRSSYWTLPVAGGWTLVSGVEGVDALLDVETIQFAEQAISTSSLTVLTSPGGVCVGGITSIDMSNTSTWSGGAYLYTDASYVCIENSSNFQGMFGSFSFDQAGQLSGGTIESMASGELGQAKMWITGMNLNLAVYDSYVSVNNVQGLNDYVLSGNDLIFSSSENDILYGAGGNDTFVFAASGTGTDTITDFSAGDLITVAGAAFSGGIASGNGSTVLSNQIQLATAGGTTTLYIGTDSTAGADVQIQLTGTFSVGAFVSYSNIIALNNIPAGSVTITGTAARGQTLTVANTIADADGLGTISYQWQAEGIAINGATNDSYFLTQAEVGKAISVVASYTDGHGTAESITSSSTANVYILPTSRYYVTQSPGSNLLDFELAYGTLSLQDEHIVFSGTSGTDNVSVVPGIVFDFTGSGASADNLYLTGNYGDYTPSLAGTTMTLTRTVGLQVETVKIVKGSSLANSDKLVFADGTVSTFDLSAYLNSTAGAPVPAGETSLAPSLPATLNAIVKAYAVDSTGETFAPVSPGINLMAIGSAAVDIVYVKAGSNVDAASLGGGFDKIYFTGSWADYTKTVAGTSIIFERTVGSDAEYVKVAAAAGSSNDYLVFADGYVRSNDAKTALLGDANAAIATVTGYSTTEVTPLGTGDIVTGTTAADPLNGTAAGDTIYGNGGADTINGGAGNDTIVITDADATAAGSATVLFTSTANGTDTLIGFSAAAIVNGGDVLDFSAIANLTDAVATGQTLTTDFAASNVFIFDSTPITIADAANAIANDVSVLATDGYIVIADSANRNAVTVYHSADLAGNGTETALVILSGVNITQLTAGNFLV